IFLLLLYYFFFFFLLLQLLPRFTLFPYTTLFRSTAKDISNVVTDAASGVVDIFHGIDKAVADTWNNFWKDGKADGIGNSFINTIDRKSGSAGMPRPNSYAVFCLKKDENWTKAIA